MPAPAQLVWLDLVQKGITQLPNDPHYTHILSLSGRGRGGQAGPRLLGLALAQPSKGESQVSTCVEMFFIILDVDPLL